MASVIKGRKHNPGAIRVLYMNLEGSIAGAEQSFLLFVRFAPKNIKISVVCPAGALTDKLNELGIRPHLILSAPRKFNYLFVWFFYLALLNLQLILIVFKIKPQIIHANNTKAVLAAVLSRIFFCKKLIWHMRDLRCSKLRAKICSFLSSKIITVSKTVKDKLVSLGVKAELIEVIYNSVTVDDISDKSRKNNRNKFFTFANIGQFVPWKKQHLFIEAAERFLQEIQQAQFFLIGDDIFGRDSRYKKDLISRVEKSSFAPNIKVIGWQDDLDSYWPQINCLIHTTEIEPFGRVIIEAMAHSVPVIASAGGPSEIITDGKTGLLFKAGNIEELFMAMKTIFQNRELANKIVINAKQHIACHFQASKTAEKISKVYEELIAA